MMGKSKVQIVSETENFQLKIDTLDGAVSTSRGLIEASIEDLKANSAEMATQITEIDKVVKALVDKRNHVEAAKAQNDAFIAKLVDACNANIEA